MNDIKTAAQALVDKLDIALAKIDDAIVIAAIHGHAYDGPQFSRELNNLKTALERDKAIDELVKHDQEIGLYDAPDCDVCGGLNISCPQGCQIDDVPEWGEPFYGSDEIISYLHFANEAYAWINVIANWSSRNTFSAYCPTKIYRLPANHKFYQTALFANAQKPDANHPCRKGE